LEKEPKKQSSLLKFSGAGFQMLAMILLATLLGNYLDKKLNSENYTLICSLSGVLISVFYFVKKAIDFSKDA
jgi:hypothetical protein